MADDDDIKNDQDDFEADFDETPEFDRLAREREMAQRPEQTPAGTEDLFYDIDGRPRNRLTDPALVELENAGEPGIDDTTPLIHTGAAGTNPPPVSGPVRTASPGMAPQTLESADIITPPPAPEETEPASILIDNLVVEERSDGAVIGGLSVVAEPFGENATYLVDDERFEVVADQLKLRPGIGLDYDVEQEIPIRVEVTDTNNNSYAQNFTILVHDINVAPVDIDLDNLRVAKLTPGAVVGQLSTFDPDLGDTHIYAVSDDRFEITDGTLKLQDGVILDGDTEPAIDIDITATDPGGRAYTETFMLEVTDPVWPDEMPNEPQSAGQADSGIGDPFLGSAPTDEIASNSGSDFQLGTAGGETDIEAFMAPALSEDMPYAAGDLGDGITDIPPEPDAELGWTIVFDDGNSFTGTGLDYMDIGNGMAGTIYFDDGSEFQFNDIEDLQ